MNKSLKASLIQKMYFNPDWFSSKLLRNIHPLFEKKMYPFLQISPTHFNKMESIIQKASSFLMEALQSWLHFQYYPPEKAEDILQQILWLNSNILSGGKVIFFKQMFIKGITFVNDIVNEKHQILSYKQLRDRYGEVCTTQQYNQLTSSLSSRWKQKIKTSSDSNLVCRPNIKQNKWINQTKINKEIYKFYLHTDKLVEIPCHIFDSWEKMIDSPLLWKEIFNNLYE